MVDYVCPECHQSLEGAHCGSSYSIQEGIADFSQGRYYDDFQGEESLTAEHRIGLAAEVAGSRWRIENFYVHFLDRGMTVLDCGCGNGVSVDVLHERGMEAWGIDLSRLRKWQWREREQRDHLAVADALRLPFPDHSFDVVLTSGVIEHIGVREIGGAQYQVAPEENRHPLRQRFVDELLRVIRPGGRLFIDCPNGAFPIDFWHGREGGRARWHRRDEGFLPTFAEIRAMAGVWPVRAISPHRRFAFRQVGQHWYGRLLAWPMRVWLALMAKVPVLAATSLNPYLVVEIRKSGSRDSPRRGSDAE